MLGVSADLKVKFTNSDDNQQIMIVTIDDGNPIKSIAYEPISYSAEKSKTFVGSYYSNELNVSYDLRMKNDSLMLYINGKEISPLLSIKDNLFSNDSFGIFDFRDNIDGSIKEFELMAGRVKNLKFIKSH